MRTVGEILREKRKKLAKTILSIHRQTKIPQDTLRALENNDFDSLPPATFVKGFIRVYAQALGLSPQKLIAIFRRDWQENQQGQIIPKGLVKPLDKQSFGWNPKTALALLISLILTLFLSYLGFHILNLIKPPKLDLKSPLDNQKTKESFIKVVGKTNKDSSVYVNNQLIDVSENGDFFYQLKLFPGENLVEVRAVDRNNKETVVRRKVEAE